jgi:hypothetical protein
MIGIVSWENSLFTVAWQRQFTKRGYFRGHKTGLTQPLYIEVHVHVYQVQKSELSDVLCQGYRFCLLFLLFFDFIFRIVLTVWYS